MSLKKKTSFFLWKKENTFINQWLGVIIQISFFNDQIELRVAFFLSVYIKIQLNFRFVFFCLLFWKRDDVEYFGSHVTSKLHTPDTIFLYNTKILIINFHFFLSKFWVRICFFKFLSSPQEGNLIELFFF